MANDIYLDDFNNETIKQILQFVGDDFEHPVDTSWLSAYDQHAMDAIARWRAGKEAEKAWDDGNVFDEDDETAIRYALSTAYAMKDMLRVLGDDSGMTTLFLVIASATQHAYEFGVHDAYRKQLSNDAMERISRHIDEKEAFREAMLEFHKEVQQL